MTHINKNSKLKQLNKLHISVEKFKETVEAQYHAKIIKNNNDVILDSWEYDVRSCILYMRELIVDMRNINTFHNNVIEYDRTQMGILCRRIKLW